MKVKERIEELRPFCPENSDYDWCKSNLFVANALNKLWRELGCYDGSRSMPSTEHNRKQLKKYKYAEKKLYDFIKNNVDEILELSLEEKNNMYLEIVHKAVSHYKLTQEEVYERLREIDTSNFNSSSEVEAYRDGYIDCFKWTTNTMIEKACEWLKEEYPKAAVHNEYLDDFIDRFKQAMKED